jgi:hypothetical protein
MALEASGDEIDLELGIAEKEGKRGTEEAPLGENRGSAIRLFLDSVLELMAVLAITGEGGGRILTTWTVLGMGGKPGKALLTPWTGRFLRGGILGSLANGITWIEDFAGLKTMG